MESVDYRNFWLRKIQYLLFNYIAGRDYPSEKWGFRETRSRRFGSPIGLLNFSLHQDTVLEYSTPAYRNSVVAQNRVHI